jgi:hypothetical protein
LSRGRQVVLGCIVVRIIDRLEFHQKILPRYPSFIPRPKLQGLSFVYVFLNIRSAQSIELLGIIDQEGMLLMRWSLVVVSKGCECSDDNETDPGAPGLFLPWSA